MTVAIVWFRQDLRLSDNPAFFEACLRHEVVIPLYILDKEYSVLGEAQHWWLHHSLLALQKKLKSAFGLELILRKGASFEIFLHLIEQVSIDAVYWNRCYEPRTIERDKHIKQMLLDKGIQAHRFNGLLLHEPWTIKNKSGDFFKVFTPYWRHCRATLSVGLEYRVERSVRKSTICSDHLDDWQLLPRLDWTQGFSMWTPGEEGAKAALQQFLEHQVNDYKMARDYPSKHATSYLSAHLHFGEISPWAIVRALIEKKKDPGISSESVEHFLSELGWREFSYYLLFHVPSLPSEPFNVKFNRFSWDNHPEQFKRWTQGMTGYPLVDAGMRELWATGYMHNRVRMIVASFLTKSLLIDWKKGADWFLHTLLDADLASNSMNWQWVAGSGVDAAPYFRIFNPIKQSQTFDKHGEYIRRWVPELASLKGDTIHCPWAHLSSIDYPRPIIDHAMSRLKALERYKQCL